MRSIFFLLLMTWATQASSQISTAAIDKEVSNVMSEVVEWRRHFHQHPELSNREHETAKYIEKFLREMGLEVKSGIAHTGVIGYLKGGKPGPTIGLRADMDALPVTERGSLPFASTATTTFLGKETGVMHACGHDTHMAMLLGAARVLTRMKNQLPGNIVFVFQPAEEGPPPGEKGGAKLMVEEGLFELYPIEAFFGQHIWASAPVGTIEYRAGALMAAVSEFNLRVLGRQAHGSMPWEGVDPVTASAQIILGFQNIVSRMTELTKGAAVISVGKIDAGMRSNILPEEALMIGTIRTFDDEMKEKLVGEMQRMASNVAEAYGATAELVIKDITPVTYNDPALTARMIPTLNKAGTAVERLPVTGGEDFAYFGQRVPSLFVFIGGRPLNDTRERVAAHHTPDFFVDESGMVTGVKNLVYLALDYLSSNASKGTKKGS